MRALKRHSGHQAVREEPVGTAIADECGAFLAGAFVTALHEQGRRAPVWAWLNEAAHSDGAHLRQLADDLDPESPDVEVRTRSAIARATVHALADRPLSDLQRDLLVPLELRLAGTVLSPRRLVELVGVALYV